MERSYGNQKLSGSIFSKENLKVGMDGTSQTEVIGQDSSENRNFLTDKPQFLPADIGEGKLTRPFAPAGQPAEQCDRRTQCRADHAG